MNPTPELDTVILELEAFVRSRNWVGYDPYDLRAHPLFKSLLQNRWAALPTKTLTHLFPLALRRLFHIQPVAHPKAMALFADAYLNLYEVTHNSGYLDFAGMQLDRLRKHATPGFSGLAWGLPFDYIGRDPLPAGAPSIVITSIAARVFLHAYQVAGQGDYLEAAASACRFLATDIPRFQPDENRICFSKSPAVHWYIHNANLMTAATLAAVGRASGHNNWNGLARKAVNYSLAEQHPDGSWYYWSPPNKLMHWIDHYHTGFVLRALDDLLQESGWEDLEGPLARGYTYYIQNLFAEGCIPCLTNRSCFPVDIHSCAEAILCLSQLAHRFPDAMEHATRVLDWTLANMRDRGGFFYYRRYRYFTAKIPYMRWGQAWMIKALTEYQATINLPRRQNKALMQNDNPA